jgi:hypothetical protein
MTIDDLKKSIKNDDNPIDDHYGIPKEKWLRAPISLQDDMVNDMLSSPIRKSKYKHWSDRITCTICGGEYARSYQSGHRQTKVHKAYAEMNDKIRDLLVKK